jgi:hypothetical protein
MNDGLIGATVLIGFAGTVAAVSPYDGLHGFVRKWVSCAMLVSGLVVAGVLLGLIMRSAMCASVWVCD